MEFSYAYERSQEKRESRNYEGHYVEQPSTGRMCPRCQFPVEASKHFDRVWYFDYRTDTLHVCRPTYMQRAALREYREGGK